MTFARIVTLIILSVLVLGKCGEKKFETAINAINDPRVSNTLNEIVFDKIKDWPERTHVSVAIVRDSIPEYYGFIRSNDSVKSANLSTQVFEIGSITKLFTTQLLVQAVRDSLVSPDELLSSYYDFDFPDSLSQFITLEHLANHTSGLPRLPTSFIKSSMFNSDNPYKDFDEAKLKTYMREEMKTYSVPGEAYEYSNLAMGILAQTVCKQYEKNFEQVCQSFIFQPFKMTSTFTSHQLYPNDLVEGLNRDGQSTSNWDLAALQGAGSVVSSAQDMARFIQAQFQLDSLRLWQMEETLKINDNIGVARGWHIRYDNDRKYYWHNGATGGYSSCLFIDPEKQNGVVILSNVSGFRSDRGLIDRLCYELLVTL
jgi:CubicO group peptidase (beta-lactamase class C family)